MDELNNIKFSVFKDKNHIKYRHAEPRKSIGF